MNKLILTILCFIITYATAQIKECPRHLNCESPGKCGLFQDNDADGYCDLGIKPNDTNITLPTQKTDTIKVEKKDDKPKAASSFQKIEKELQQPTDYSAIEACSKPVKDSDLIESNKQAKIYPFWEISIPLLLLYAFTFLLTKLKKLKKRNHEKLWNWILAISFIVSCVLGLFMAIFINESYYPEYYSLLLKLHVDFGIAMTLTGLFHLSWHIRYYFKKRT